MKRIQSLLFILLLSIGTHASAALIDFDSVPTLDIPALPINADGVNVSFSGLSVISTGSTTYGFGGVAGYNNVVSADSAYFSGNFLTATGYHAGYFRATNYTRTITFDQLVSDVSMYVADIDAGQGVTFNAFGWDGSLLDSLIYPASTGADSRVTFIDFTGIADIQYLTIVGNDPIGIDNLSFNANVPAPATILLMGLGLIAMGISKRQRH